MSKKKKVKLSKASKKLIKEFDEAAKEWGWTADQGSGESVYLSEHHYDCSKDRLIAHVLQLETELKQCKEILKCEGCTL